MCIACGDGFGYLKLLNELSDVDLLLLDDFLTRGVDPKRPTISSRSWPTGNSSCTRSPPWQPGQDLVGDALPDRVATDSNVNRLANILQRLSLRAKFAELGANNPDQRYQLKLSVSALRYNSLAPETGYSA